MTIKKIEKLIEQIDGLYYISGLAILNHFGEDLLQEMSLTPYAVNQISKAYLTGSWTENEDGRLLAPLFEEIDREWKKLNKEPKSKRNLPDWF